MLMLAWPMPSLTALMFAPRQGVRGEGVAHIVDANAGHTGQPRQALVVPLEIIGVDRRAATRAEHQVMFRRRSPRATGGDSKALRDGVSKRLPSIPSHHIAGICSRGTMGVCQVLWNNSEAY